MPSPIAVAANLRLVETRPVTTVVAMHLYLVRHAHAVDGTDDAERPLSGKGIAQIRDVGRLLREAEAIEAHQVWHSPFLRAQDTAVRLVKALQLDAELVCANGLRPSDEPEIIARRLRNAGKPVMVVGHDPHLSALASLLVFGRENPPRFVFKKCAVLRLDRETIGWTVRWLVSPELV